MNAIDACQARDPRVLTLYHSITFKMGFSDEAVGSPGGSGQIPEPTVRVRMREEWSLIKRWE